MSVWVWAFANHKIEFDKFENKNAIANAIFHKLNSLRLSDDKEFCQLFRCNPGATWQNAADKESDDWPLTLTFTLGHYDVELSNNFIFHPSVFPYTHWFAPRNDSEKNEIEFRQNLLHTIVKSLGGNIIEYFPDNMLEQSLLMPTEQEDYEHLTMNKHMELVTNQWPNVCYSYGDAVNSWLIADYAPLLIEYL